MASLSAPRPAVPSTASARAGLEALLAEHGVPATAAPGPAAAGSLTRITEASAAMWGLDWPVPAEARPSAVLILFGALDDVPAARSCRGVHPAVDVLLTQRAATLRQHAGQVAFPGGRVDPEDGDVVATALREAREETGLDPAGVDVLGVLPPVPVSVSGHVVHPVVGWWRRASEVGVVDHGEAAAVFRMPVADLVAPVNRVRVARPGGRRGITPGFLVEDRLVWGFTAALLDRVLHLLGWDEPWDEARVVDAATRLPLRRGGAGGPGPAA
ncbi:NUDIX hydrolase [Micrococcus flavus]|uniref:8-oxo-dGTP pyrophosphatase MutT (NUDIX family) n=2 Tax=Micrococcus flavus TaxID=384602 RepID=A0A7W7L1R1_9MICC|nr:8-oxo-dGTP pyrophosphatase MutT (NUDIX family) [Micrococcus flavus]GGK46931.1 coenzyme A pyrophosphatase [Micrococcus flavus]